MKFSPLITEIYPARVRVLKSPLIYHHHSGQDIIVPAGFDTDFASVPRGLWNLFPPDGDYVKAAVVHDYLYWTHYMNDRAMCDELFFDGMEDLNGTVEQVDGRELKYEISWAARHTIYRAVRAWGWTVWNKKK